MVQGEFQKVNALLLGFKLANPAPDGALHEAHDFSDLPDI